MIKVYNFLIQGDEKMNELINSLDNLPLVVKLILCIPLLDVVWSVYKLCRSITKNNVLGIILAILTIVPGATFIWIIDLLTLALTGKVWWLD